MKNMGKSRHAPPLDRSPWRFVPLAGMLVLVTAVLQVFLRIAVEAAEGFFPGVSALSAVRGWLHTFWASAVLYAGCWTVVAILLRADRREALELAAQAGPERKRRTR